MEMAIEAKPKLITLPRWSFHLALALMLGLFLVLNFVSLGDRMPFIEFTLDDSYITYRYSENLAQGHGPVWNIGEDPVEGYTSFLWMLLNSGFIKAGVSPEVGSKLFSLLSATGLMLILALIRYGKLGGGDVKLAGMMGAFLGPQASMMGLFFSAVAGLVVAIVLTSTGRLKKEDEVPYSPFLLIGCVLSVFFLFR